MSLCSISLWMTLLACVFSLVWRYFWRWHLASICIEASLLCWVHGTEFLLHIKLTQVSIFYSLWIQAGKLEMGSGAGRWCLHHSFRKSFFRHYFTCPYHPPNVTAVGCWDSVLLAQHDLPFLSSLALASFTVPIILWQTFISWLASYSLLKQCLICPINCRLLRQTVWSKLLFLHLYRCLLPVCKSMPQILPAPWGMSKFRLVLMLKMVVIPSQCGMSLESCVSLLIHTYKSQTDPGSCDTVRGNQNNCFILLSPHLCHLSVLCTSAITDSSPGSLLRWPHQYLPTPLLFPFPKARWLI